MPKRLLFADTSLQKAKRKVQCRKKELSLFFLLKSFYFGVRMGKGKLVCAVSIKGRKREVKMVEENVRGKALEDAVTRVAKDWSSTEREAKEGKLGPVEYVEMKVSEEWGTFTSERVAEICAEMWRLAWWLVQEVRRAGYVFVEEARKKRVKGHEVDIRELSDLFYE